jgi:hypothetical protein
MQQGELSSTYIDLIKGSLEAGVKCFYILLVSFSIYGSHYELADVESGLDNV